MVHIAFMADYEQMEYEHCPTLDYVTASTRDKAIALLPNVRLVSSLIIFHEDRTPESFVASDGNFCRCPRETYYGKLCKCSFGEILNG